MNEKKIINIPLSAYGLQIVKSSKNWTFEYNLSEDRAVQIIVNKPCDIARIYQESDRLCVELNTYSPHEFLNL